MERDSRETDTLMKARTCCHHYSVTNSTHAGPQAVMAPPVSLLHSIPKSALAPEYFGKCLSRQPYLGHRGRRCNTAAHTERRSRQKWGDDPG